MALEEIAEQERGRAAIDHFLELAHEIGANTPPGGPSVVEVIREMREERTEHLVRVLEGGSD